MLSYHNDPAIKEHYARHFAAHRAADEVVQGIGFDEYDHSLCPEKLGWPEWLGHLSEAIFEGLPEDEGPQFGTDLIDAIPVGVDLNPVQHMIAIPRLEYALGNCREYSEYSHVESAVNTVIDCHRRALAGEEIDWSAARSAQSAVWLAAESAARSAQSAVWLAAESAARSAARSAQSAARSAVWLAAESAVWSVWLAELAESAWQRERDVLLEVLRELK